MVRTYKKKREGAPWTSQDMEAALQAINTHSLSIRKASQQFHIPKTCLLRRIHNVVTHMGPRNDTYKQVFTAEQEKQLVDHILDLETRFYGITTMDCRKLAFDLAEKLKLKHTFNKEAKLAGIDWLAGFRKRNPQISIRAPEPTSMARAVGFNRPQVERFHNLLESCLRKYEFQADQIFNIDECGVNTVPVPRKILAKKGKKQVGRIVSAERGFNITAVCGISASGFYLPPFFLFPRQRMNPLLMRGCPAGSVGYANTSGWMDSDHFLKFLDHFIGVVKPTDDRKILLVLDNHASHRTLEAITKAKENNLVLISLPPHTSHRLQPLDCCVFGPLKAQYARECDVWHTNHPGERITIYDVVEIFAKAFAHISSMGKAIKGFEVAGIWPFNAGVFNDQDFLPAEVTNVEQHAQSRNDANIVLSNETNEHLPNETNDHLLEKTLSPTDNDILPDTTPSCSKEFKPTPSCSKDYSKFTEAIELISPKPATSKERKSGRKSQRAEELTSTPFKEELKASLTKKEAEKKKVKLVKRQLVNSVSKENKKNKQKRMINPRRHDSSEREDDNEDDTKCLYCHSKFSDSKSGEGWVQCVICKEWAHDACAGVEEDEEGFQCIMCTD